MHRWEENARVASHALLVLGHVRKYVDTIAKYPKKYNVPNGKAFTTVKPGCADSLMPARLMFFESVVRQFDQFLVRYQADKPMVPFLCGDHDVIVRGLCQRFMKQPVSEEASSTAQLAKLNIDDVDSHLPHSQIYPGFCAAKKLKELAAVTSVKQKLSERERMAFRMECKKGFVCATKKLLEKCLITYTMTRNLTCLDPRLMGGRKDDCIAKFGRVLHKLSNLHQVRNPDCDAIQQQFISFVNEVVPTNSTTFKDFNPDNERLDTFLAFYLKCTQYEKLWMVTKKLLILSHGQATVERGVSINSHVAVENMKEESLVTQRIVHNHNSWWYMAYLEAEKEKVLKQNIEQHFNSKRKHECEEAEKMEANKRRLNQYMAALVKSADELATSAELTGDLALKRVLILLADIRNELNLGKKYEPDDSPFHIETVSSIDQFQNVEHSLSENPEQQKLMITRLAKIGGINVKDSARKVMQRLLTNDVMALMNMHGNRGKTAFANTKLHGIVKASVLKNQTGTETDIDSAVSACLKYAPDRIGGGGRHKTGYSAM
ncbi:hypothetical protein LSAT2_003733 [Lamellibrachia satsuma]|nr:hypothetical protein LSAT2_003733 [Lamellibrachia satsuma]